MTLPAIDTAAGIESAGKSTRRSAPNFMDRNLLPRLREMLSAALPEQPGAAAGLDVVLADGGGPEIAAHSRGSRAGLHRS